MVFWSFERKPHDRCGNIKWNHTVFFGFTTMSRKEECFENHEIALDTYDSGFYLSLLAIYLYEWRCRYILFS